jgi:hypothetical protein
MAMYPGDHPGIPEKQSCFTRPALPFDQITPSPYNKTTEGFNNSCESRNVFELSRLVYSLNSAYDHQSPQTELPIMTFPLPILGTSTQFSA